MKKLFSFIRSWTFKCVSHIMWLELSLHHVHCVGSCPWNSAWPSPGRVLMMKLARHEVFNSLSPGMFEWKFRWENFKIISVIDVWGIFSEVALRWMPLDLSDNESTLVQVMAWCRQATSHYLSQCWPRSLSPYGVTRPQWVNVSLAINDYEYIFTNSMTSSQTAE